MPSVASLGALYPGAVGSTVTTGSINVRVDSVSGCEAVPSREQRTSGGDVSGIIGPDSDIVGQWTRS